VLRLVERRFSKKKEDCADRDDWAVVRARSCEVEGEDELTQEVDDMAGVWSSVLSRRAERTKLTARSPASGSQRPPANSRDGDPIGAEPNETRRMHPYSNKIGSTLHVISNAFPTLPPNSRRVLQTYRREIDGLQERHRYADSL